MERGRWSTTRWKWIVTGAIGAAMSAPAPTAGALPETGAGGTDGAAVAGGPEPVQARTALPDTGEHRRSTTRALPSHDGIRSVVLRRVPARTAAGDATRRRSEDVRVRPSREDGGARHPLLLGAGGVLGGAAGMLAGGLVGGDLSCAGAEPEDDLCFLPGAFLGGTVGMSLGIPAGVHVANGTRGDWFLETGTSLGIWGVGLVFVSATGFEGPGAIVAFAAIPLGQLVASTAIERSSSSREEIP